MTDALKAVGRGLGYFVLILAMIGAGLKMAAWMGVGDPVSASVSAPEQQAEAEAAFTHRAIATHKIPPGSPRAICDTRDNLIGYWTADKSVVIFDDEHDATQADCW
jgi:hypothetical protein